MTSKVARPGWERVKFMTHRGCPEDFKVVCRYESSKGSVLKGQSVKLWVHTVRTGGAAKKNTPDGRNVRLKSLSTKVKFSWAVLAKFRNSNAFARGVVR